MTPPTRIRDVSFDPKDFRIRWFADGELNVSVNCLDRHLATRGDKTALIFEPDIPDSEARHVSYRDLHARDSRLANPLRTIGLAKGARGPISTLILTAAAVSNAASQYGSDNRWDRGVQSDERQGDS